MFRRGGLVPAVERHHGDVIDQAYVRVPSSATFDVGSFAAVAGRQRRRFFARPFIVPNVASVAACRRCTALRAKSDAVLATQSARPAKWNEDRLYAGSAYACTSAMATERSSGLGWRPRQPAVARGALRSQQAKTSAQALCASFSSFSKIDP
jgi:hypothetical protein